MMQAPYIIDSPYQLTWDEVNRSSREELGAHFASFSHTKAAERERTRSWNGPFKKRGTFPANFQCRYFRPYGDDDVEFHYRLFHVGCDTCSSNPDFLKDLCEACQHLRLRHLLLCGPSYGEISLGSFPAIKQRVNCALCLVIAQTMTLELEVAGVSQGKADADIECAITSISLPGGRTEARFNVSLAAYDRVSVQEEGFVCVSPMVSGRIQVRFFDVRPQSPIAIFPLPLLQRDRVDWTRVRHWLEECHVNHRSCSRTRLGMLFGGEDWKMRVVDVQRRCIRTVERLGLRYLTLSYVWGPPEAQKLRASKADIHSLEQPGALVSGSLPATLNNAITICEKLGEQYLWVDSLCILQDDADDKAREISRMNITYSSAFLNIVAAAGDNADFGIPGISSLERSVVQKKTKLNDCEIVQTLPSKAKVVDSSVWNTRGWTYQEQILATRCLFFTPYQIYFTCNEVVQHEDATIDGHRPPKSSVLSDPVDGGLYMPDLIEEYATAVAEYSKRTLTWQCDVLEAFSGITNAFEARYGDDFVPVLARAVGENGGGNFLFGLPEKSFDAALLWDPVGPFKPRVPETPIVIPSWSWISHVGPVKYKFDKYPGSLVAWAACMADNSCVKMNTNCPWMDEGRSREAAYNRDILGSFPEELYVIESEPLAPIDMSSDIGKQLCKPGRLIFQAQAADFALRHCVHSINNDNDSNAESSSDLPEERDIIQIVSPDGITAGLMEMDKDWVSHNIPSASQTDKGNKTEEETTAAPAAPEEKLHQFIALSAGRFPFSGRWQCLVSEPEGDPELAATAVVNVMLIEWHGDAARRCGIGKIFVEHWKGVKPAYKRIVLE